MSSRNVQDNDDGIMNTEDDSHNNGLRRSLQKSKDEKEFEKVSAERQLREILEASAWGVETWQEDGNWKVKSTRSFQKEELVYEFTGELISFNEAKKREVKYLRDDKGCFIFFFRHNEKSLAIDGTIFEERQVNIRHSRKNGNLIPRLVEIAGHPRILFYAKRAIAANEELLYNYNENRPDVIVSNKFLLT